MQELPVPDLDDLRFQPMVDTAKRALPQRAPRWTDHNVSDPGITLLEACAERVDMLLYRVARMTGEQRNRLLCLMGIQPMPASPCRVLVQISPVETPYDLPAGTELTAEHNPPIVLLTAMDVTSLSGEPITVEAIERPGQVTEVFTSNGTPGQRFPLPRRPLSPPSVTVAGVRWTSVATFAEADQDSHSYWWDESGGDVVFGPLVPFAAGARQLGAVPPDGQPIEIAYPAYRGVSQALPAGTYLAGAGKAVPTVDHTLATGWDQEDWRQALERAALDLSPLRRAVTVPDYERILSEHATTIARCRVTTTVRPSSTQAPAALLPPARPDRVAACAVAVREPAFAVHYFPNGKGGVDHQRVSFPDGDQEAPTDQDKPPAFAAKRVDAVLQLATEPDTRLWFSGGSCGWDDSRKQPIGDAFPGIPQEFGNGVDDVAAQPVPEVPNTYELFFFKGDVVYHRRYRYENSKLVPTGSRGVRSRIAESFPGLSPLCQRQPDAVVTVKDVFYFLKDTRSEPALWRPEGAPLRVLVVPPLSADPGTPLEEEDLKLPATAVAEADRILSEVRLLGERLRLGPPDYQPFKALATVRPWTSQGKQRTAEAAERRLYRYFHPTQGGPDGEGWPWGRRVHASEVFTALEAVPEVRAIVKATVTDASDQEQPVIEVPDSGLVRLLKAVVTVTED